MNDNTSLAGELSKAIKLKNKAFHINDSDDDIDDDDYLNEESQQQKNDINNNGQPNDVMDDNVQPNDVMDDNGQLNGNAQMNNDSSLPLSDQFINRDLHVDNSDNNNDDGNW